MPTPEQHPLTGPPAAGLQWDERDAAEVVPGVVRLATAPQQTVVVWADDSDVTNGLAGALSESGTVALRLQPEETEDLVALAGAPAALVLDATVLDDTALAVLARLRTAHPRMRVHALADEGTAADRLLRALRAGLAVAGSPAEPGPLLETLSRGEAPAERVLAVGAHPDDVEIGCGATLLRHRDQGHRVSVLTLSQGAVGGPHELRRREAVRSAMAMSAELLMADLPDTRLEEDTGLTRLLEDVVGHLAPTTVYVHSAADHHQDHRAVHRATMIATRRVARLFCYQSPSSRNGFAPTHFVPVDGTLTEKLSVLAHFATQSTRHYLEEDLVTATARYWARQVPHARYVEPFEVVRSSA